MLRPAAALLGVILQLLASTIYGSLAEASSAFTSFSDGEAAAHGNGTCFIQARRSNTKMGLCDPPRVSLVAVPANVVAKRTAKRKEVASKVAKTGKSGFHDVVGDDGVLMISLESSARRYEYSAGELGNVNIFPAKLPATDGSCTSHDALEKGCAGGPTAASRTGNGCVNAVEAAIADSHRRALEIALARSEEWTAIFEDDAIPVLPEDVDWDVEFQLAWASLPDAAKFVRLSWCQPPGAESGNEPTATVGDRFQWLKVGSIGGCTAAYMVHKSIIPDLLKVFPCGCAVDCCYEWDFFNKGGSSVLWNLAAVGADEYIAGNQKSDWGTHHGVLMQAKNQLGSTRNRGGW